VRKSNGEAKPEAAAGDGFVDLQLQKALDYIKAQLEARKKMTNDEKPNDEGMPKSE
jgi:hypothetical protein